MDLQKIVGKIKKNCLSLILVALGAVYLYLAAMPKHGDFWTIYNWSATFTQDPLHYMDILLSANMIQIYPPTFNAIQAAWIMIGAHIFNYKIGTFTFTAHPSIFPLWGMIPTLVILLLFAVVSYITLKNKWLTLICFGTFSFVSVIVMGQIDIWYAFFVYISIIFMLKSFDSERYILYISLAFLSLGISLTFKTFGGLLFPVYILFMFNILKKKNVKYTNIFYLLILFTGIFIVAALAIWIPYAKWFIPVSAEGESSWLLNLQIAPIGMPSVHIISIWLLGYILILYGILHDSFKNNTFHVLTQKSLIFYCFTTIAWLFIAVYNHPQWWALLLPFILLLLDNFKSKLNYLFVLILMSMFIFYPMLWVNNVDLILPYYIPVIPVNQQYMIGIATMLISVLVVCIINLRYELINSANVPINNSDNSSIDMDKFSDVFDKITPLLITLLPFIFCILLGYAMILVIGTIDQGGINPTQPVGEIYGNITANQSFISKYNNLNSVNIYMATYGHQNLKDVIFHLKTYSSSNDIATVVLNGSVIKDNTIEKFQFPPIPDSMGKEYYFMIDSPGTTEENSFTIWYSTTDTYAEGTAYYNGQPLSGDLSFDTHYKPTIYDLLNFIGKYYPKIGSS